jgi:hypothetical protein
MKRDKNSDSVILPHMHIRILQPNLKQRNSKKNLKMKLCKTKQKSLSGQERNDLWKQQNTHVELIFLLYDQQGVFKCESKKVFFLNGTNQLFRTSKCERRIEFKMIGGVNVLSYISRQCINES